MMKNDKEDGRIPSDLIFSELEARHGNKPWETKGGRFDHVSFAPTQLPNLHSGRDEHATRRYQEAVEKSTSLEPKI